MWLVVRPFPVLPSPNLHSKVMASPSGSDDPAALKVTDSPVFMVPLGSTLIVAVGGLLLLSKSVHPANMGARNTNAIRHASSRGFAMVYGHRGDEINPAAI